MIIEKSAAHKKSNRGGVKKYIPTTTTTVSPHQQQQHGTRKSKSFRNSGSDRRGGGAYGGYGGPPPPPPPSTGRAAAPTIVVVKDPEAFYPGLRESRLEGAQQWTHDMHQYGAGGGTMSSHDQRRGPGPRDPSVRGTKLFISNLDYKVTREDIKELFETIGPVKMHQVNCDPRTGRSLGTAEVVFEDREVAVQARERYHSIELDGKPMQIELIEQKTRPGVTLKSGIKISGGPGRVVSMGMAAAAIDTAVRQPAPARGRGTIKSRVESMQMD